MLYSIVYSLVINKYFYILKVHTLQIFVKVLLGSLKPYFIDKNFTFIL